MRIQEYLLWIAIIAFEGFRTVQTVSLSTNYPPLNTVAANPHSQCGTFYFFFFSLVLTLVLCLNLWKKKLNMTSCIPNLFRKETLSAIMDAVFLTDEK